MEISEWRQKLTDFETELARFPHVIDELGSPATDSDIDRANAALGRFQLPEWLEALYRWHNGCGVLVSALLGAEFTTLDDAVSNYENFTSAGDGWFRPWTFPFLLVDKDVTLGVLDGPGETVDLSILRFFMQETYAWRLHSSPMEWVDELLFMLSKVDEDSFKDDGAFWGYPNSVLDEVRARGHEISRKTAGERVTYGEFRTEDWPQVYLDRAGLTEHLIAIEELPSEQHRRLRRGEPIPHVGPWDVYFPTPPPQLPTTVTMRITGRRDIEGLLPAGVLPDYSTSTGIDVRAVVWFTPESFDEEIPVIARVGFPVRAGRL